MSSGTVFLTSCPSQGPVASASAAAPRAPAGGCAPPPPPGPPPPPMDCSSSGGGGGGDGGADTRNALFASLNKGGDVTTGLKHVSDDQKTHKNPTLRGNAPVRAGPKPFTAAKPAMAPTRTLPPVLELDGKKWKVVSSLFTLKQIVPRT